MSGLARAISSEASSDGYEPKVILITGAAGFIGSHTALRLVKNLPNVRVSWESRESFSRCSRRRLQPSLLLFAALFRSFPSAPLLSGCGILLPAARIGKSAKNAADEAGERGIGPSFLLLRELRSRRR